MVWFQAPRAARQNRGTLSPDAILQWERNVPDCARKGPSEAIRFPRLVWLRSEQAAGSIVFDPEAGENFLDSSAESDKVLLHHNLLQREKSNTHAHTSHHLLTGTETAVCCFWWGRQGGPRPSRRQWKPQAALRRRGWGAGPAFRVGEPRNCLLGPDQSPAYFAF